MMVTEVKLYHVSLPLKFVFKTAKAAIPLWETLIIQVTNDKGQSGYGECVSFTKPFYTDKTLKVSKKLLIEHYLPWILGKEISDPFDIHKWIPCDFPMAVAGLENALLDLYGREQGKKTL